jgi:alanine racemase
MRNPVNMENTWVEISKSALLHNIREVKSLIGKNTKLISVIKANAYGHGLCEIADIIENESDYLAVINLDEAKELRESEIKTPIIVLGYTSESVKDILWAIQERVELVANSLTHAERLSKLIENSSGGADDLKIHVKIDTGMGRMGIMVENAVDYIKKINELPHLRIKGVMSHFADTVDHKDYAKEQLQKFENIKFQLFKEKIEPPLWHIAKTEAIFDFPESHLDAIRLGVGLYGLWPDKKLIDRVHVTHADFNLKPALSWKTKVLQVKDYPKGEFVGYGCTHKTKRETKIAIFPVGYYEGYDRGLSNKSEVLINGKRCPIIGRICMNMSMADVTDVPKARRDDDVILIGNQIDEEISADELAEKLNTINYEVVTRINPKIERRIVD